MWRNAHGGEPRQLVLSDPPGRDPFDDPQWDGEPFEDELDEEPEPAPPEPPDHGGGKLAGLVMAAAIVAAYAWTGPRAEAGAAFRAGSADAGRILSGEVWRAATALTLHADLAHLVANATAGAFLATAVCRIVGGGLGAFLIVVAGVAGNLLNAALNGPPHDSIGASTAVLAAVGILSGLAFVRTRRTRRDRARAWLALAAGLALLGMLGADPHSDLGAHLCGFLSGVVLGALCGWLVPLVPGRATQRVLAAAALALVVVSWWLALRA